MALDDLMAEVLFSPLGMHDASFVVPSHKFGRFAQIYEAAEAGAGRVAPLAKQRRRFERHNSLASMLWSTTARRQLDALRKRADSSESAHHTSVEPSERVDPSERMGEAEIERARRRISVAIVSCAARPGALDSATLPKVLSDVAGEPVLAHVLRQLHRGGRRLWIEPHHPWSHLLEPDHPLVPDHLPDPTSSLSSPAPR
jgi:CubicO group peptidase (beta-lactamase class C family)